VSASPRISVVIPVRNGAATIPRCLECLRAQTWPREDFEVLVIDNGSTDGLEAVAGRHPEVRWLRDEGGGSYSARNRGLREARGEVIAFTDADCLPDPSWLERGVAALGRDGAGVVGGEVIWLDPVGRDLNACEILETIMFGLADIRQLIAERGFAITANLFTRRDVVARVGPFDAGLRSAGDREWVHRAVARGEALRYGGDVIVRHPRRSTLREFLRKQRRLVGGRLMLLRREHPGWRQILADLRKASLLDRRLYRVVFGDPRARRWPRRIELIAVGLLVSLVTTGEKLRVLAGGEPSRGA
jgi:glycosyltransferase involved in cell wall biosynthesis